ASTKNVLERMFADDIRAGRVIVKEVNYDLPENRDLLTKYEIIAPTVIMVQVKDGKEVTYRNLMEVWQTVHEPDAFDSLISGNLRELLPKTAS
ncbi:MAG: nitrophenyl compound nitroreductase subunit ArsF family protein, partial [Anaerolineae bacterium]